MNTEAALRDIDPNRLDYLVHLYKTGRIKQDTDAVTEPIPVMSQQRRWIVTLQGRNSQTGCDCMEDFAVQASNAHEAIEVARRLAYQDSGWNCSLVSIVQI